jgi:hypothetical protein
VHRHRDLLAAGNGGARAVASTTRLPDPGAVLEQESARETFRPGLVGAYRCRALGGVSWGIARLFA